MESGNPATNVPDRVRLPLSFDTGRMREEVRSLGLEAGSSPQGRQCGTG